jgi:hypothetical protein
MLPRRKRKRGCVRLKTRRASYLSLAATVSIEPPVRQMTPAVVMLRIKTIAIAIAQQSHIVRRRKLVGWPLGFRSDIGRLHYPEPNGSNADSQPQYRRIVIRAISARSLYPIGRSFRLVRPVVHNNELDDATRLQQSGSPRSERGSEDRQLAFCTRRTRCHDCPYSTYVFLHIAEFK